MRICSGPGCTGTVPDDVTFCDECKPNAGSIKTHRALGNGDGIRENVPAGKAGPSYRNGLRLSGNERAKDDPIQREYMCAPWTTYTRRTALQKNPFCAVC